MAESSICAFIAVIITGIVLAIVLFVIRKYSPRENNNEKEKPILNKCNEPYGEVTFSRSHLLQANATIIAGLFIFLTIQGITVAGIPALIDTNVANTEIKKYDEIRKDETRDQVVRDEATKRYATTTLDLEKQYIRLAAAYDFKNIQYFTNPIVIFFTSLLPFSFSCILIVVSKSEYDWIIKIAKILTLVGFFLMFSGALLFIGFPIVPSG